jgi:hypothetical protein
VANAENVLTIRFLPGEIAERDTTLRASLLTASEISCVCGVSFDGPRDRGWLFVIDGNDKPSNSVPSLFGHGWLWTGATRDALCPEHAAPYEIDAVFAEDPEEVTAAFAADDENEEHDDEDD